MNVVRFVVIAAIVAALFPQTATVVAAEERAGPAAMPSTGLWFNAGGGVLADGTDGMKMVFHCGGAAYEQVWFTGKENYYNGNCTSTGFNAKVGGTNFGSQSSPWTSVSIREYFGSATLTQGTAKGDGYAVIDYTATAGGYTYTISREIAYTYPNQFFTETYTVTVPAGAPSQTIALAKGGDTMPGGEDNGVGAKVDVPFKTVLSIEPTARKILGFRETVSGTLTNIFSGYYGTASSLTGANNSFAEVITTSFHDTGLVAQYLITHTTNAGAATTYTRGLETLTSFQSLGLQAQFGSSLAFSSTTLTLLLANYWSEAAYNATGVGFTFTLPSPMTIDAGMTTTCSGGTVTATAGTNVITVSGVTLNYLNTCRVAVPVSVPSAGVVELGPSLVSGMTATGATFLNNVAVSSIDFNFGLPTNTRTPFPTASNTPTNTLPPTSTPTNTATPSNTATNTATATATNTPTNTATNTATATATATNTATATSTPTATNTPTATRTPSGQYITFATPPDKTIGTGTFSLAATSSVGATVTYTSDTPSVCTVTPTGTVTMVTFGTCTITTNAASTVVGGVTYAAAPPVSRSFTVNAVQTISFTAPSDRVYTAPDFNIGATNNSGLAMTYSSSTPSVCTISAAGVVHMISAGTCTVTASQAGGVVDGKPYAAATVTQSFIAKEAPQTVNFPAMPEWHTYDGSSITLTATASTGLPVTYTSSTPTVCTVTGNKVTVVGTGKCTIKAVQLGGTAGGVDYAPSAEIVREFFITDFTPTATKTSTPTKTFTPTLTPSPIPFLMKKGAVGASFVLGLLQNGTLISWGMNREYQANIPPCCGSGITDIAVGTNFALAIKGGAVYGWGANTRGQLKFPAQTKKNIVAIAAGGAHGLALTKTGLVYSWGDSAFKQSVVPKGLKNVTGIAGGAVHSLVILKTGTVQAWGGNASGQTKVPAGLKDVTQVAAGLDHSLALKKDGSVVAWGGNTKGQATVPSNAKDIKQISAGNQFSLAVKNDGSVFGWGDNTYKQLEIPAEYTDIFNASAGYTNTILGLRNGRVIVLGDQSNDVGVSRTPTKTATPTP